MTDRNEEEPPAAVSETTTQAGDHRARWGWVEPTVGTERMLAALEKGVKEGQWFSLIDKVYALPNLRAAFQKVKAHQGAAGVDHPTIKRFEPHLEENLDKLSRTLQDGSYRPQAVRRTGIDKPGSKDKRPLGIPTVRDRVVQSALRNVLGPIFERDVAEQSYGFRTTRGCQDALRRVSELLREGHHWIVDADLKSYFDNISQDLLMRAVKKHAKDAWVGLYIERWLKAPVQEDDGQLVPREKGTPQGGVISPLLANLFLHYAFDRWLTKQYPQVVFERYADDAIVHCRTEAEAQEVRVAIAVRLKECGLELHPEKTKIVYCKDDDRRGTYSNEKFDFLGYTFRPRRSKNRFGKYFVNFSPAVSDKAVKAIRTEIRSWNLHLRSDKQIEDLSRMFNPKIRGWLLYYGRYYRSALYPPMRQLDRSLARWAYRKYKKLRGHLRRATHWIARISRRDPRLFAHWQMGVRRGSIAGAV